jgi:hypothetical protein
MSQLSLYFAYLFLYDSKFYVVMPMYYMKLDFQQKQVHTIENNMKFWSRSKIDTLHLISICLRLLRSWRE